MSSYPPEKGAPRGTDLAAVDVAVLAGGLGTRLRSVVGETPKILAPVNGTPFLDHLLAWLDSFGVRRVVMCLGFRAELVVEHLKRVPAPAGMTVATSIETEPMGTGGALRLAAPLLTSDPVLVMNGDTFVDADLASFVAAHRTAGARASILAAAVQSTARYGRLHILHSGMIDRFAEKDPSDTGPGSINAGLYLFSQSWLQHLAQGQAHSLERDVFASAPPGSFRAIPADGVTFIDIGTPESFAQAGEVIAGARQRHPQKAAVRA